VAEFVNDRQHRRFIWEDDRRHPSISGQVVHVDRVDAVRQVGVRVTLGGRGVPVESSEYRVGYARELNMGEPATYAFGQAV